MAYEGKIEIEFQCNMIQERDREVQSLKKKKKNWWLRSEYMLLF